jgi:hypothetical protein
MEFINRIPVNCFYISQTLSGYCTAYMYTFTDTYSTMGLDQSKGRPVLYADGNYNIPYERKSKNENLADFRIDDNRPTGWRTATFQIDGNLSRYENIWFGVFSQAWETCFDYTNNKFYYSSYSQLENTIPNDYPFENYEYQLINPSMYFINLPAQANYRFLTESVYFPNTINITETYRRFIKHTAGIMTFMETIHSFRRFVKDKIKITIHKWEKHSILKFIIDSVGVTTDFNKIKDFIYKIQEVITGNDKFNISSFYMRVLRSNAEITQKIQHWRLFLRRIFDKAINTTDTKHYAGFHRKLNDDVKTTGMTKRNLFIVILVKTKVFARDLIFGRFLVAKTELVIKSCICIELIIESRLN